MNVLVFVIIYLSGIYPGYFLFRKSFTKDAVEWTISLRRMGLLISVLSWIVVGIYLIIKWEEEGENKPAKW